MQVHGWKAHDTYVQIHCFHFIWKKSSLTQNAHFLRQKRLEKNYVTLFKMGSNWFRRDIFKLSLLTMVLIRMPDKFSDDVWNCFFIYFFEKISDNFLGIFYNFSNDEYSFLKWFCFACKLWHHLKNCFLFIVNCYKLLVLSNSVLPEREIQEMFY